MMNTTPKFMTGKADLCVTFYRYKNDFGKETVKRSGWALVENATIPEG
jgi:hypothetical protein